MTSPASTSASLGLHFKPEITCAIGAKDWKAATKWYQEVLGFQQIYAVEEMPWGEFQSPLAGCTIGIGGIPEGEAVTQGGAIVCIGTTDIEADRAALEKKGVRFEGPTEEVPGMVKLATFSDPEGNRLMLAQTLGMPQ